MSSGGGVIRIAEMLLILILGGQDPDPSAISSDDWSAYVPQTTPAYVEINLSELVLAAKTTPELKRVLDLTADRDGVAAELALLIGSEPAAVKEAFSGIRRIGFWFMGMGDDAENFRYLIVIDRHKRADVLPALLANNVKIKPAKDARRRRYEGYISTVYNGATIHGFRSNRNASLWATEREGLLAIGSDRFAIQSFLLRTMSGSVKKKTGPSKTKGIIEARGDVSIFLNELLTMMRGRDREEMAAVSSFFDLPAWRSIVLRLSKDRLLLRARIESASRLAKVLAPLSEPPALLSVLPEETDLAVVVGLKDPGELWSLIRSGIMDIGVRQGRPQDALRFEKEFQKELGIDLQKDLVDNIAAAGVVVPTLKTPRDLERRMVVLAQAKDASKAEVSLSKFIGKVMRGQQVDPMVVKGTKIWSVEEKRAALAGKTVMLGLVGQKDGRDINDVIEASGSGQSALGKQLAERFPKATVYGVFNPAILLKGREVGRMTAGLTFASSIVTLDLNYSLSGFAKAFADSVELDILNGKKKRAEDNLKKIVKGAQAYMAGHGKYPSGFNDMMKNLGDKSNLLVSPVSGKRYQFNSAIANAPAGTIANRGATVLAHEAMDGLSEGGGHVVFLNGSVKWLPSADFQKIVKGK